MLGQGPDELFGGYRRHLGIRHGTYWKTIPTWARRSIASLLSTLPRNETVKRGLYSLDIRDRMRRYQNDLSILPGPAIDGLFQDGIVPADAGDKILQSWTDLTELMEGIDGLGGFQYIEVRSKLPDELLLYTDKLSMTLSLELRVPYLDKEIVQFAERLPAQCKIRKWLHCQFCQSYLPSSFIKRKKRGFAVNVVDDWFRGAMDSRMAYIFMDGQSKMYQYLRPHAVQQLYKEHASGRSDNHKILSSLIVFEEWLRVH